MRYIFTAAVLTLMAITAILALPPLGETDSVLNSVSAGDRAAIAGEGGDPASNPSPRQLVTPENDLIDTDVLGLALVDDVDADVVDDNDPDGTDPDDADNDDADPDGTDPDNADNDDAASASSSSTTAPTTTAPETTTTTSTTTSTTTTTTVAPETTTTTAAVSDSDGGVIISPNGVVLPVIGPASGGGVRALTPCRNEVTLTEGERVVTVDFLLDPGHGGSEPGAVGPAGNTEKELNQRIAEITEWYLEEAGYSVLLTRTTDIRIPLRSRAEMANALQPDAFVSIHHNGGATRRQDTPGTEMFYDAGNPESRRLGGLLFEEMTERFSSFEADWVGGWRNGVSARLNDDGADLYGIHRYTPEVVSIITEAGYLSNASEEALFADNDFQWAHGRAIAEGLIRWKTTNDEGTGHLDDFVDGSSSGTGGFDGCTDPKL